MQIRREQMNTLDEHMRMKFEDFMVGHLWEHYPVECEEMGEDQVRDWIRHGTERAAVYEVEAERDVCKYIDVMFAFGRDFDQDPGLPWAGEILTDPRFMDSRERMDRLTAVALEHLE